MHVLLIADGRSPHTAGWVRGMDTLGIRTTLLSSHVMDAQSRASLQAVLGSSAVHQPEDAWSRIRPRLALASASRRPRPRSTPVEPVAGVGVPRPSPARRLVSELELQAATRLTSRLDRLIEAVRPDAVHALRVQFEGIAATGCRTRLPIAVSTWGLDLVYTPRTSGRLLRRTSQALRRVDLLMSDCHRDAELASSWGLRSDAPRYVIPGNFGVRLEEFPDRDPTLRAWLGLENGPLVVYPRGVRGHVNHQGFVHAVRRLVAEGIDARFVGVGLSPVVEAKASIPGRVVYTDKVAHRTMLSLAAWSAVTVSPAFSDGTPNSVLEGMAGGSIPVCGELDSLRELERQGAVIAWCQPGDPASIASAIKVALELARNPDNGARNRLVVAEHHSAGSSVDRARDAYQDLVMRTNRSTTVDS